MAIFCRCRKNIWKIGGIFYTFVASKEKGMIVVKNFDGSRSVYDSVHEAGDALGVTGASVSYAAKNGTLCKGHVIKKVDRYYVVRVENNLLVCKKSSDGRSWIRCDGGQPFPIRRSASAIDVSKSIWG